MLGCGTPPTPVTTSTTKVLPSQPPRLGTFGKPVPYRIVAVPEDGRWTLTCEARVDTKPDDGKLAAYYNQHGGDAGDALEAFLYDHEGREHPISSFLDHDPSGRWLAILEGEQPILIDTRTWTRTPINATLPEWRITTGRRDFRFDPSGQRLSYYRAGALIVRELASGAETTVAPVVHAAHWTAGGEWITYERLDGDTNRDGFINGRDRSPPSGMGGSRCGWRVDYGAPIADLLADSGNFDQKHMDAALHAMDHPDTVSHHLWRPSDRKTFSGEAVIAGDIIVNRRTDDTLWISSAGGTARQLAPAKCKVSASYAPARSALVVCETGKETATVSWYRDGARRDLFSVADASPMVEGDGTRYAGVYPRQAIIDMQTGKVIADDKRIYHEWSDASRVFVVHSLPTTHGELRWDSGRSITFPSKDGGNRSISPPYLVDHRSHVNLDTGQVKQLAAEPILVRSDGAILLDGGLQLLPEDAQYEPHVGPLRWVMP